MHLLSSGRLMIAASLLILSWSASVSAAATVSVTPSGDKSYSVQGSAMDGVAGIQLDIAYDTASLGNPSVTQGGLVTGAMLAANTSLPGLIKIAIISTRPFSGSGQIAAISFASRTGSGSITSVRSSMIDSTGAAITSSTPLPTGETAAPEIFTIPGAPFSQTPPPDSSTKQQPNSTVTTATSTAAATTSTSLGTVTLPAEQQQPDPKPVTAAPSTVPPPPGEPAPAKATEQTKPAEKQAADAKSEETPQYVVYKGIIDRFKQHKGSNNLTAMAALFDKKITPSIVQEPAILLSDGRSKGTLSADITVKTNASPNFAVNGGTLVSFKQNQQSRGRWVVEVLPETGASRVTVTIIAGAEELEFPLTVAPPVKTALALDENGWKRFMKEVGTAEAPLHDFNNDGVRDYVDEFIFVANYLVRKSTQVKPAGPAPARKPLKQAH